MRLKLLGCILLFSVIGFTQDKPATPKLKDSVALDIRTLQFEESQLQIQWNNVNSQLQAKLATALTQSDIDATKYTLDPNSLQVVEIPKAASKATEKK